LSSNDFCKLSNSKIAPNTLVSKNGTEYRRHLPESSLLFYEKLIDNPVGTGKMSHFGSKRIASIKVPNAELSLTDSVVSTDAFFPFHRRKNSERFVSTVT
jgi:hypothetical protein